MRIPADAPLATLLETLDRHDVNVHNTQIQDVVIMPRRKSSALQTEILKLAATGRISAVSVAKVTGAKLPAIRLQIKHLVERGMLQDVSDGGRNKYFSLA